jgi:hypothetical protein
MIKNIPWKQFVLRFCFFLVIIASLTVISPARSLESKNIINITDYKVFTNQPLQNVLNNNQSNQSLLFFLPADLLNKEPFIYGTEIAPNNKPANFHPAFSYIS